jgi:nanoRNase/pAp phosphatase (c-di-AMP/oligoRNAs hydrolase)
MVRALEIPLWHVDSIRFLPDDAVMLVDTQPGFGNNSLPPDRPVTAVFDHHSGPALEGVPYVDVRPNYGAVVTMLAEYVAAAGIELPSRLATAICYGIATETQDLGREASEADVAAFLAAFPYADQPALGSLRHPRRSAAFFVELDDAIRGARMAGDVIACHLGSLYTAEAAAEMADVLISVEGVEWAICTGASETNLVLSVRTRDRDAEAGEILRGVVGESWRAGGHGMMAGGSVPLQKGQNPAELHEELVARFMRALGRDPRAEFTPLMAQPGAPRPDARNVGKGDGR